MSGSNQVTSFTDEIDDAVLQDLYAWVDQIPLSRPKKNITRDFSDGVLVAEVIAHYFPKLVEIHNYPAATGTKLKIENWRVLNRKVFKKLNFELAEEVIKQIVNCVPYVVERVLLMLRTKVDTMLWDKQREMQNDKPEVIPPQKEAAPRQAKPSKVPPMAQRPDPVPTQAPKPAGNSNRVLPQHPQAAAGGDQGKHANIKAVSQLSNEFVPRLQLAEKEQECLVQEETIQILQAKIRRLEHLLHLKDIRIEDLQSKVEGVRPTGKK